MPEIPDNRKHILVVDDQPFIAKLIEFNLDQAKYQIDYCRDPEAALIRLKTAPPDLLITDVCMPKITGPELCRQARQSLQLEEMPIIILTSRWDTATTTEAIISGASAFMTKPFSPRELAAKVAALLGET